MSAQLLFYATMKIFTKFLIVTSIFCTDGNHHLLSAPSSYLLNKMPRL